jgi:hypothetical protein
MPRTFLACPTAGVETPVEVVWQLLTTFSGWGNFFDVRVVRVEPAGPASKGQRMIGETGPRWLHLRIAFEFTRIDDERHELEFDGRLPLGINVHEALDCVPLGSDRCRVNYQCNFTLPSGWRGIALQFLLRRGLADGPADSLSRLKRAAERAYQGGKAGDETHRGNFATDADGAKIPL